MKRFGPGPGEVSQDGLKVSIYDVTHKKSKTPNKKFFELQTTRLAESFWVFEQLSSTYGTRVRLVQSGCFGANCL